MDFVSQFQGVLIRAFSPTFSFAVPSLSLSLPLSPSFRLFLSPSGSRLPSFLPSLSCNKFIGQRTQNKNVPSSCYRAYFIFVRSRKNLHTCKLTLAGSRSPIIKYARGSHIGFAFPIYKPDTFVRASIAQVRCVHYLHRDFTTVAQRRTITSLLRNAYFHYFDCKIGDQDKSWAQHICCKPCYN